MWRRQRIERSISLKARDIMQQQPITATTGMAIEDMPYA